MANKVEITKEEYDAIVAAYVDTGVYIYLVHEGPSNILGQNYTPVVAHVTQRYDRKSDNPTVEKVVSAVDKTEKYLKFVK